MTPAGAVREVREAADELPPIDLTVVLFNSKRFAGGFAEGVEWQTYPHGLVKIWLVDNGEDDGALSELVNRFAGWPGGVVALPLLKNVGFTGANNLALGLQRAPYALLVNPDTKMEPGCLEGLVRVAEADGNAGIVEARQKPVEHPKPFDRRSGETSWSSLGCALVRRSALDAAGALDDAFFMYCEDVDLSWRMRLAGFRCVYVPSAAYEHFTDSPGRGGPRQTYFYFRNHYYLRRIYSGAASAGAFRLWWLLRSWAVARPLAIGGAIRRALRDAPLAGSHLDSRRRGVTRRDPWISFAHPSLGPKRPPRAG